MLKNLRAPVLAASFMLYSASAMAGGVSVVELVVNGGFETGDFSGWTQFPNAGSQAISSVNPSSGSFSANLIGTGAPTNSLIKAANVGIGLVSAGQQVDISFDMRGSTADGGVVFAEFFSEVSGGGTSAAEILSGGPLFPNADPDVWTTFTFTAFAGPDVSGGITLQLGAVCGGAPSCVSDIYFDNVSMTTVVPVPGAVWLFGSALGLLGLRKRLSA
jgi:hypothetical protein